MGDGGLYTLFAGLLALSSAGICLLACECGVARYDVASFQRCATIGTLILEQSRVRAGGRRDTDGLGNGTQDRETISETRRRWNTARR
jgi:hypothetical protein